MHEDKMYVYYHAPSFDSTLLIMGGSWEERT